MKRFKLAVASFLVLATVSCGGDEDAMPNPPSDLKVTSLAGGGHLTWKDNSDNEAQFMIERKTGGGAFQALASVPFDTILYHDAPLTSGTTYTYRVMAMGKSGHTAETKWSNEAVLVTP